MAVTQRPERTAVARRDALSLREEILADDNAARLIPLLAKGDKLERIAQIVMIEARKNPALLDCDPVSVVDSVSRIMAWGLEVGETAYLVPFGNKCQPLKGYQGLIQLMYDTGHVRRIDPHVVRKADFFEYEYGLNPQLRHIPGNVANRGEIVGVYCVIGLPFQNTLFRYFTTAEVDAIRQQYSKQWKKGPVPEWYALKTAIIHTAKMLPKSSKFGAVHDAVRSAERELEEVESTLVPDERPAHVDDQGIDLTYEGTDGETEPADDGDDDRKPLPVDRDLAWAMSYVIPGLGKSWGGHGGQDLGVVPLSVVSAVQTWAARQMEKPDGYAKANELEAAATIVMEARTEAEEKGVTMLSEMELPLGDTKATKKSKDALANG